MNIQEFNMYFSKNKLALLLITLFQVNQVFAYPEATITMRNPTVNVSGPADNASFGTIVSNSGSQSRMICNNRSVNYTLRSVVYEPVAQWSGQSFHSYFTYPLFESGVVGFSLTPMGGNIDDGPNANFRPLPTEITTTWTGSLPTASRVVRVNIGTYVYKDENRYVGNMTIPGQIFYRYHCKDAEGITQEAYNVMFSPTPVVGSVTGCTPTSGAQVLDMDKIAQSTIKSAGSTTLIGTKYSTFSLLCDPNIKVFVSFVDLSDQKNKTNIATLTADSTATGVGFAVAGPTGNRFVFGPDGSAMGIPGQEKYFLGTAGAASFSQNNPLSMRLGFSYVRNPDKEIKPGTAKAAIGITYSYQ